MKNPYGIPIENTHGGMAEQLQLRVMAEKWHLRSKAKQKLTH